MTVSQVFVFNASIALSVPDSIHLSAMGIMSAVHAQLMPPARQSLMVLLTVTTTSVWAIANLTIVGVSMLRWLS
jgi:hypothetical protein